MSTASLRFYSQTLAYHSQESERRLRDVRRMLRTQISRRRFRQVARNLINLFPYARTAE